MAISPPPPDATAPAAEERRLDTLAAQREAIDALLALGTQRILVFDRDLADTGWDGAQRADNVKAFLRRSRHAQLRVIVHDTASSSRRARGSSRSPASTVTRCRSGAPAPRRAAPATRC